jgi:adenylate kinase family enzyme
MNEYFPYRRIVIVGTTGSGKSTLAERLAQRLNLDFIELDALHWEPNWNSAPEDEFRRRVEVATRAPAWAIAGNYSIARDVSWPRAEAILWLDYPLPLILWRLWKRTWKRWWTKELLWGTNYEQLLPQLKLWSEDSLFKWAFKTHWRRKREYPQLFATPQYSHLKVFRFQTPQETEQWLAGL